MNLFLRLCLSPLTCLERFQFKIPYSSKRFQSIPLSFFWTENYATTDKNISQNLRAHIFVLNNIKFRLQGRKK